MLTHPSDRFTQQRAGALRTYDSECDPVANLTDAVIIRDAFEDIVAILHPDALPLFVEGISRSGKTLYDLDKDQFVVGTVGQLT